MSKAKEIINKARTELIEHIKFEMCLLHTAFKHDAEEDLNTDEGEWPYRPSFLAIADTMTDVEDTIYEKRCVTALYLNTDGSVSVTDSEEIEHTLTEFSTDELMTIAETLEDAYNNIIKK